MPSTLKLGTVRKLTDYEKMQYPGFRWVTCSEFEYTHTSPHTGRKITILIPKGFLSDGCTGCPGDSLDYGHCWIYHDYLYATHQFSDGQECTREDADWILRDILRIEKLHFLRKVALIITRSDCCCCFSRSWKTSGARGAKYLVDIARSMRSTWFSGV